MDEDSGAREQINTRSTSYRGIAFRPGDKELWASEADLNGIGSLFVGALAPSSELTGEQRIIFPGKAFPAGIAFSSDGLQAFVALNNRNTVAVVDAVAKTIVREIPVGLAPLFLRLSPDGKTLFVSNRGGEAPASGELGTVPVSVVFSADGKRMYVAAALNNAVVVLQKQGSTYAQAGAIPAGWFPGALEAEKSGHLPDLMVLGMTSDHTMGTAPGAPTPAAMVADNDLALPYPGGRR
jgi:DNA-binding beta-propeller fold protein YncE